MYIIIIIKTRMWITGRPSENTRGLLDVHLKTRTWITGRPPENTHVDYWLSTWKHARELLVVHLKTLSWIAGWTRTWITGCQLKEQSERNNRMK